MQSLLPDDEWPHAEAISGWWSRQNNPEIDLIGADREPLARRVHCVGSIKWLDNQPFGRHEYDALVRDMLAAPAPIRHPRFVVFRCGAANDLPLTAHCEPENFVRARQPR
ncbi:hypothetical protein ACGFWE_18130 [Streptomyces sp. NPDC048523]|uniref:hypothetical protein n=1 Tax=Streptomyces sp. NPDC048523 TaxID=3365567 RepID=UPI0037106D8E